MLNTDAHNPQVKHRMTKADFMKNNRGINDSQDLPEELLSSIYDDIVSNEIRMKDEMEAAPVLIAPAPGLANALANVGRDLQKEAYVMQSNNMANKTEVCVRPELILLSAFYPLCPGLIPHPHAYSTKRPKDWRTILQRVPLRACPADVRSGLDTIPRRPFRTVTSNR